MNINKYRGLLASVCIASILGCVARVDAAPVRFDQVVQIVNARPGSSDAGFARLRTVDDNPFMVSDDNDDDKKKNAPPAPQDGRVITETRTEIVTDDYCECEEEIVTRRGFPKWALLGLAAIPIAFIIIKRRKDTPTPTRTIPNETPTPPGTPTPTPPGTPTPTPPVKGTPTPTPPHVTPSPTPPQPVPEPITILLFGTGLASIGMAARRKMRRKGESDEEKEQ